MTGMTGIGGRRRRAGVAALLALAVAGCGSGAVSTEPALVRVAAPGERPAPPAADLTAAAGSSNALGLDLLHTLTASGTGAADDLAVSPSSLATALAMLAPGARGATATELAAVLHTRLPADRFATATGALARAAQSRAAADGLTLRESATVWLQRDYAVREAYLDLLASAFDTGVRTADFKTDPEGARRAVNALVERQTEGYVKELFPPRAIDSRTRLALTDTLYLKADWASPFRKDATRQLPFHLLDGSAPKVATMSRSDSLRYGAGSGWQAVELPYQGGRLALDVLLPAAGTFADFRAGLDGPLLDGILGGLRAQAVDLALPRFAFDWGQPLVETLRTLGVRSAFGPAADFTGIPADPKEPPLSVQSVVQKVHLAVDEQGTTAAAASGVSVRVASAARPPGTVAEMRVDRPFLFLIREVTTGQALFLGQVTDPR
ncbi:serpin family protein [Streptomyces sp. NPDC092296]|uniref:serpin family protein n=1 Tax=Streptomyces sp. NPDC092296 TaxID=3366012 RepID=UPI003820C679